MKLVRRPPILNNEFMTTHGRKNVKKGFKDCQVSYDSSGNFEFYGTSVAKELKRLAATSVRNHEPVYLYSLAQIRHRALLFQKSLKANLEQAVSIHFAMKANSNLEILKLLQKLGYGIDVVSLGELKIALKAGFKPGQVVFSGVGKTTTEITQAIKLKIFQLNVESVPELARVGKIADKLKIPINIGVRINPGVNPQTHPYIATGFRENKFGIDPSQLQEVIELFKKHKNLCYQGLSLHIGSQLFDFSALAEAIQITRKIDQDFEAKGLVSKKLDVGGGIGVDYKMNSEFIDVKTLSQFTEVLQKSLKGLKKKICFEPGRFILARAGVLLSEVQYVKQTPHKNFLIINSGMNHLLRPALYQAEHRFFPLKINPTESNARQVYDVVGPICESSDVVGRDRSLPIMQEGDWLAIVDTGAYGYTMASHYNSFPLPKEIFA